MVLSWTQTKKDRHSYWTSIAYLICSHSPAHIQDIADLLHFFHTHDMDMPMPMPSLLGWQQSDCLSPASTAAAVQVKKNAIGTVFWCSVLALHGHELTTSSTCIFGASLPTCLPQAQDVLLGGDHGHLVVLSTRHDPSHAQAHILALLFSRCKYRLIVHIMLLV